MPLHSVGPLRKGAYGGWCSHDDDAAVDEAVTKRRGGPEEGRACPASWDFAVHFLYTLDRSMLVQLVAFAATLFAALNSTGVFKYEDHPAFMWCAVVLTGIVALITLCFSLVTFLTAPGSKLRHVLHSMTLMLAGDEADRVLAFYRRNGLSYGHYSNPITNRLERESVVEFMCPALFAPSAYINIKWPHKDVIPVKDYYHYFHYENFTWVRTEIDPDRKEAVFTVTQRGKLQCHLKRPCNDHGRFGHLLGVLEWLQSNQKQGIWEGDLELHLPARIRYHPFVRCCNFESIFTTVMDGDGFHSVSITSSIIDFVVIT